MPHHVRSHAGAAVLSVWIGFAVPAFAQTPAVRVNALHAMELGRIIGGFEAAVRPDESASSAQFEVIGPPGATVQLMFTLPTELTGESGAGRMGAIFGPQSAAYSLTQSGRDLIPFDPRSPFMVTLPASGRISVTIGMAARPSRQLGSGHYVGNISLVARII